MCVVVTGFTLQILFCCALITLKAGSALTRTRSRSDVQLFPAAIEMPRTALELDHSRGGESMKRKFSIS